MILEENRLHIRLVLLLLRALALVFVMKTSRMLILCIVQLNTTAWTKEQQFCQHWLQFPFWCKVKVSRSGVPGAFPIVELITFRLSNPLIQTNEGPL